MQIYELHKAGKTARELAEQFGLSESGIRGDLLGSKKANVVIRAFSKGDSFPYCSIQALSRNQPSILAAYKAHAT